MQLLQEEAFNGVIKKYGCVDILVNNAGVSESTPFTEYTEEIFDKVMDLNVKGVFNAARAISEHMIERGNLLEIKNKEGENYEQRYLCKTS